MRNLKKLLAVVLTVVMIASMMVPALAANTYEAEALKLQSIGMFAGEPADLKLEEGVTRIQGLAFAIRAAGKEADAFAMTDEEVATILADYLDGADVPTWGRKYAAYAIKNGITVGVSATEKKFAALDPISGTSFLVFLMKAGMGYADVTTANVVEASVTAGILTAGQAASFGAKAALIRDDAAGILFGAAMNGVNADGTPLIEALIASGFVDADAALAAGFVVEVVPEDLEVVSVEAINLKQIIVEFNKEVTDDDTIDAIEDDGNYKLTDSDGKKVNKIDSVSLDGVIATITLVDELDGGTPIAVVENQEEYTLKIDDKILDEDEEFDFTFNDTTLPLAESAEVIGIDTIKVTFSEPILPATISGIGTIAEKAFLAKNDFSVNSGSLSIKTVELVNDNTEANIILYSDFDDGDTVNIKVKGSVEDYAGYSVISKAFDLVVEEDDEAPVVVGYKDADKGKVTLIFNEDIKSVESTLAVEDFYHTNTKNEAKEVSISGKELTIKFETDKDETGYAPMPAGTAYIYIADEAIQDYWENENDKIVTKIEIVEDDIKPEVKSVEQGDDQDEIVITFSEDVDASSATDKSNYTVKDSDGDKAYISKAVLSDEDEVTLTMRNDLEDGEEYTILIEDVEDLNGNVMKDVTFKLLIDDKTAVLFDDITAKAYNLGADDQKIIIDFGEAMMVGSHKYAVDDLDKYVLKIGTTPYDVADLFDAEIDAINNNKAVEITLPFDDEEDDSENFTGKVLTITIAKFADAAENAISGLAYENIPVSTSNTVAYDDAPEATDVNTITFSFDDKVDIDSGDFSVWAGTGRTPADKLTITKFRTGTNSDGNTTVTITIDEDMTFNAKYGAGFVDVEVDIKTDPNSENSNGALIAVVKNKVVADGIAPAIAQNSDDEDLVHAVTDLDSVTPKNGTARIVMTFEEIIDKDSVSKLSFEVEDYTVSKIYATATSTGVEPAANGKFVVIELTKVEDLILDGFTVTQKYAIADVAGNEVDDIVTEVLTFVDSDAAGFVGTAKTALALTVTDPTAATATITLPATIGADGVTITWVATSGTIATGTYTTPARAAAEQIITLTARLAKGTESDTQTFTLTIPAGESGAGDIAIVKD